MKTEGKVTETCDILIIGGGPAGSSLAWGLRHSNLHTVIADKKQFPRDKTCAGWITPSIIDALEIDIEDYKKSNTLQAIEGFRVGRIYGNSIEIKYDSAPISYGIRRCEFDHYLLRRSQASIRTGFQLEKIIRNDCGWLINDSIQARLVVGAGGNFCPVARLLGAKPGNTETSVRAQEIEFRLNTRQLQQCHINAAIPELYFCNDLKGYGWVFRKGDHLNIGLGREDESGLPRHVKEFCRFLREQNRIPDDIPDKFNGHAYQLYQHSSRLCYADNILLIGDAAGLAYTQSGEGIRPAIESGLIAANVILNAQGNYSSSKLKHYEDCIIQRFGKRRTHVLFPQNLIPAPLKQFIAHSLLRLGWFVRDIVINNWFLHQQETRLNLPTIPAHIFQSRTG